MSEQESTPVLEVSRNGRGQWQLSISSEYANGSSIGYRMAGPKFDGSGTIVFRHVVKERDRAELLTWLDGVPDTTPGDPR